MVALERSAAGFDALSPLLERGRAIVKRIAALPFPTLAAVHGVAAGAGLNLALACDLRLASDRASFGETFVRLALHPDWGGTYALPRLVGLPKALELCWTGEVIDAAEALRIGLVNRVIPHDRFEAEVAEFAAGLARAPPASGRLPQRPPRAALPPPPHDRPPAQDEAHRACWGPPHLHAGLT